jgi:hypothetical protein
MLNNDLAPSLSRMQPQAQVPLYEKAQIGEGRIAVRLGDEAMIPTPSR